MPVFVKPTTWPLLLYANGTVFWMTPLNVELPFWFPTVRVLLLYDEPMIPLPVSMFTTGLSVRRSKYAPLSTSRVMNPALVLQFEVVWSDNVPVLTSMSPVKFAMLVPVPLLQKSTSAVPAVTTMVPAPVNVVPVFIKAVPVPLRMLS